MKRCGSDVYKRQELFDLLNKEGVTIVMITHAPEIASYAKRVVDIFDGEISERKGDTNES